MQAIDEACQNDGVADEQSNRSSLLVVPSSAFPAVLGK